ncbi:MAG: basic membrane protein A, partial [Paracoccaceae bacterium]
MTFMRTFLGATAAMALTAGAALADPALVFDLG